MGEERGHRDFQEKLVEEILTDEAMEVAPSQRDLSLMLLRTLENSADGEPKIEILAIRANFAMTPQEGHFAITKPISP